MPRSALSRLSAVSSAASRRTCRNNYIVWHYIKIVEPSTRCSTLSRRFSLACSLSLFLPLSLSRTLAQRQYFRTISILLLHITQNAIYFFKCSLKFSTLSPRTHTQHENEKRKTTKQRTARATTATATTMENSEIYGHLGNFTLFRLWGAVLNAYMLI